MRIQHDSDKGRFFAEMEHGEAELDYEWLGDSKVDFFHVFVPPQDRLAGAGEQVVLHALEWARSNELTVVPGCPFARRVMGEHPEYDDLRAESS